MTTKGRSVAVFSLGGTIAMTADPATGGVVPALSAHELLAAVPGLDDLGVDLRVHDFRRLPGASLTLADIDALYAAVAAELADGADGAVVVQGTDTIEETAFHLDLLHRSDAPLVVTGAMRNPTQPGPDGPANLYAAIVSAAGPALRGAGCVVVLGDEVHAARTVRKGHTTSPAAFTSPGCGPLGIVVEGAVRLHQALPHRTALPTTTRAPVPDVRVALHTVTLGDDGALLGALEGHYEGLVVAAFGVGHVPERVIPRLDAAVSRVPVVLASRIGNGPVVSRTYSFPGSESDLLARGLIRAGDLDPYKCRLLLYRLLSSGCERAEIAAVFASIGDRTV